MTVLEVPFLVIFSTPIFLFPALTESCNSWVRSSFSLFFFSFEFFGVLGFMCLASACCPLRERFGFQIFWLPPPYDVFSWARF